MKVRPAATTRAVKSRSYTAELTKGTKTMAEVEECKVPVVSLEFLEDAAEGDALGKIPKHTISPWAASRNTLVAPTKSRYELGKST